MSTTEIKVGGLGGQGVILAGMIIGRGASIHDTKHATLTQSFGPEARGSACSAQVVIDSDPVLYPYVTLTDFLVAMSQEGYSKFIANLRDEGTLVIDKDLVIPDETESRATFAIPATRIAERELGRKIVANIVMLGFVTANSDAVSKDGLRQAILSSIPEGTEELNIKAYERGYAYGANAHEDKEYEPNLRYASDPGRAT